MHKEDRLYKLSKGSETAMWAHDEIVNQDNRIAELEKIGLELVSTIECHHDSAYCDVFDYEELKAAKEALKEKGNE